MSASGNLKVKVSLENLFQMKPNAGFWLFMVSIEQIVTFALFILDEIKRSNCTIKNLLLETSYWYRLSKIKISQLRQSAKKSSFCPRDSKVKNLSQYCRDNELNIGHIHETLYGKRLHHKGYKLIPRTNEEIKRYENERSIREDTSRKGLPGERNGRAILDWNKVSEIRKLHTTKKYKNQEIADMFGIKKVTLEKIVSNKIWTVQKLHTWLLIENLLWCTC